LDHRESDKQRFWRFIETSADKECPQPIGFEKTIWQSEEVEGGDVEACQAGEWLPDGLEKSPCCYRVPIVIFGGRVARRSSCNFATWGSIINDFSTP
jgi:hypothetical protein